MDDPCEHAIIFWRMDLQHVAFVIPSHCTNAHAAIASSDLRGQTITVHVPTDTYEVEDEGLGLDTENNDVWESIRHRKCIYFKSIFGIIS